MTTFLAAYAALMTRALGYVLTAFLILVILSAAAMANEIVTALPTGPAPAPEVPTITLWRDGMIMVALVVAVGFAVWAAPRLDRFVNRRIEFHGLAAALIEHELIQRGVVQKPAEAAPAAAPEPTLEPIDDPWAAEADKLSKPPVPPTPRRPHIVASTKTAKQMATELSPFTSGRKKGRVMQ